ncbi:PmgG-like head morphogenesis [Yersinia phage fHe-Yen9-02]|nr:PmgG-like head morphogenesis [Yersinia phage fHe-Yen9-02]
MANYLMPSDGQVAVPVGTQRSRSDIISVDAMYKFRIYNKARTIEFTGFIPPDFAIDIQSSWAAPYGDTTVGGMAASAGIISEQTAGRLSNAAAWGGVSTLTKQGSAKFWQGPGYLSLSLPVLVDAYSDTKTEVVQNLVHLLSLCAPTMALSGVLVAPGPIPAAAIANETVGTNIDDSESFTIDIGNFMSMSPCVVESVTSNFDNVWEDGTGNPISVDFILSISSYFAVTRQDLKKWFKLSQTSINGA